jgi:hypothetical protein
MSAINRMFQLKFKHQLFCPPVEAQSIMHRATKGKEIDLTNLIAAIGSVLDGICEKEFESCLKSLKG